MKPAADSLEEELIALAAECSLDPLRWVMAAFEWGEGELAGKAGPEPWQRELLEEMGRLLREGHDAGELMPLLLSRASGHGIGKSACVAWICLWAMVTSPDTKGVVTANTENQLKTKTWAELSKWYRLCLWRHWFQFTATALYAADPEHAKTWRIDMVPWSENKTESFAGLHNEGKRILVVFDEASAIPDVIWEVTEGALTDEGTEIIWVAFGNPTRNTGRFRETFGRLKHRWHHAQIDSRTVSITNKRQIAQWIEDYGEDSDFVRVRVRGMFPRAGSTQFIPSDVVERAIRAEPRSTQYDPLIIGVDVARFGDDQSVIWFRRGRDARHIPAIKLRNVDTMQLAARVAAEIERHRPDAVFVDETGIGGGVVDRLRQLGHAVVGVNFGSGADAPVEGEKCANKRAEIWARLREWLKTGGSIPDDRDLTAELEAVEYGYNTHNEILLERKDDMKKRGLSSPDCADALAITFAHPVAQRHPGARHMGNPGRVESDYDPI